MNSTCPEVPSFGGIRQVPATSKRAMPTRRSMPKPRKPSASAASAVPKTPITQKEDASKPNLTVSVSAQPSLQRDDGPEEGEISDEEDDHYSPREATTPVQIPQMSMANPFQTALAAKMQAPLINPFPSNALNGNSNDYSTRREQLNIHTLRTVQETDPKLMPMPELRKAAQAAVMYLACSAKMSFEDIVAEGVDRGVLAASFNQLKLPIPFNASDSSKNVPTTVLLRNAAPVVPNGLKATAPTPTVQQPLAKPKPENNSAPAVFPNSLPPKPPIPVPTINSAPKPESVVSRFNQAIPGLNVIQPSPSGVVSPPLPTPDALQEVSPTTQSSNLRGRKRPVAADFDTEIKPVSSNSKQPRFGNRQHLETSHLIFDVSDNEDEDHEQKMLRITLQGGPSRPDSTNPEKNEKLEESLRQKELEIENMRQKIMAMSRKRKLATNGEVGSVSSSKPSTPLPVPPSADLLAAKESSLEKVEEFLHETLDQISAGAAESAVVEAAVELAASELMDVEANVDGMNVDAVIDTPPSIHSPMKSTAPVTDDSEARDDTGNEFGSDDTAILTPSDLQVDERGRRSSDDKSFATAPIDLESESDDADALGSPMDLSDLESTSDESEDAESDSKSDGAAEDSESSDTSDEASRDESVDVEMHDTSGNESPANDSDSSPVQESPDDENDDPEAHKSSIGEVSLLPITEIPSLQPLPVIGASEPQRTPTAGNNQQPKQPEPGFIPYRSQLSGFRSFRYHPSYTKFVSQGYKSLTYSNHIDSELPVCDFETRGGTCNDPKCRWQHFRQMSLPEDTILLELAQPDANQANKDEYKEALSQIISQLNGSDPADFDKIAGEIVEYRRQQLGDPTRIIRDI